MAYKYKVSSYSGSTQCNFCIGGCRCGYTTPSNGPVWMEYDVGKVYATTFTSSSLSEVGDQQCLIKDNKVTLSVPGAETFDIHMEGSELLHVKVVYSDDTKNQDLQIAVPKKYLGASPTAVYRRGILTLTWEEPETVSVEVEFQE